MPINKYIHKVCFENGGFIWFDFCKTRKGKMRQEILVGINHDCLWQVKSEIETPYLFMDYIAIKKNIKDISDNLLCNYDNYKKYRPFLYEEIVKLCKEMNNLNCKKALPAHILFKLNGRRGI